MAWMLGFVAGTGLVCLLPDWRAGACLLLGLAAGLAASFWRRSLWPWALPLAVGLLLGASWALASVWWQWQQRLPVELHGQKVVLDVRVQGLPERQGKAWRFEAVDQASGRRLRLFWDRSAPDALQVGSLWRLSLRQRLPRGLANPGDFDYERWLFLKRIAARGSVYGGQLLADASWWSLGRWRQALADGYQSLLSGRDRGVLAAIALGDRRALEPDDRELLRLTGSSHLIAISGLHVALVFGWFWGLSHGLNKLAIRWGWLDRDSFAFHQGLGLAAAALYALVSGLALPTQRALVMLSVLSFVLIRGRAISPGRGLSLAAFLVVLVDPLALLDAGFWLSFGAVFALSLGAASLASERDLSSAWSDRLRIWWASQWWVFVGLLVVVAAFFPGAALLAPWVNLLAIPWFAVSVVPLALLGLLSMAVSQDLASWLLALAAYAVEGFWWCLQALEPLARWALWPLSGDVWARALALLGVLCLLLPRALGLRWPGLALLLPLFVGWRFESPLGDVGDRLQLTVFDVGQGSAILVRWRDKTLLYDAAPRYRSGFDMGERIVLPALRQMGVASLDHLMVSHGDQDHAGGSAALLSAFPGAQLWSGEVARLAPKLGPMRPCQRGDVIDWGPVSMRLLSPFGFFPRNEPLARKGSHNNRSCVLAIEFAGRQLLLTGDIERSQEGLLLAAEGERLRSDVLLVPHHGSLSSSSSAFVAAVRPSVAIAQAGFLNRYRFPRKRVVKRYVAIGARVLSTGEQGAIRLTIEPDGSMDWSCFREAHPALWRYRAFCGSSSQSSR